MESQNGATEGHNGALEGLLAISCRFVTGYRTGITLMDLDPHQSENSDPDSHQNENLDPHQSDDLELL